MNFYKIIFNRCKAVENKMPNNFTGSKSNTKVKWAQRFFKLWHMSKILNLQCWKKIMKQPENYNSILKYELTIPLSANDWSLWFKWPRN